MNVYRQAWKRQQTTARLTRKNAERREQRLFRRVVQNSIPYAGECGRIRSINCVAKNPGRWHWPQCSHGALVFGQTTLSGAITVRARCEIIDSDTDAKSSP